jgi:hypothetical protein
MNLWLVAEASVPGSSNDWAGKKGTEGKIICMHW